MRGVVVCLGLALAGALFLLGIRELRINRKRKHGLFISTAVMALYLLGPRYTGAAEPAKSVDKATLSQKDQLQIAELVKTKEWQNFKAFWKKLDAIEPKKGDSKRDKIEIRDEGKYPGAISYEQREKLLKELETLTNSLAQVGEKIIGTTHDIIVNPVDFPTFRPAGGWLQEICYSRISYLKIGFTSKLMRAIPDLSLLMRENSLRDLELRIDALLLLQKKGKVNQDEYTQSLGNIQGEIRRYSIWSVLRLYYIHFPFPFFIRDYKGDKIINEHTVKPNNIQDYAKLLEKDYVEYKARRKTEQISEVEEERYKEMDEAYNKARQELEQLKTRIPIMDKLIADLEQ